MGIKNVQTKADDYGHNWATRGDFQLHFFNPPLLDEPAGSLSRVCDHQLKRWTSRDSAQMSGEAKPGGIARGAANISPPNFTFAVRLASGDDVSSDVGAHTHAVNHPLSQSPHLPYASLIQTRHYVTVLNAHKSGRVQLPSFSGHVCVSAVRVALSSVCVCVCA